MALELEAKRDMGMNDLDKLHQDLPDQNEAEDMSMRLPDNRCSAGDINNGFSAHEFCDQCGCCEAQDPQGAKDPEESDAEDADDSEDQVLFLFEPEPGDPDRVKSPLWLKSSEVCYCGNPAAPHKKRGCQRPARNKECEEQTYTVEGITYTSCLYCHTNPVLKCKTKKGSRQRYTERVFNERKAVRDQLAADAPPGLVEVPTDAELKQHARKDYKEKRQLRKVKEHFCNLDTRKSEKNQRAILQSRLPHFSNLRKNEEPCNSDPIDYYGLFCPPDMPEAPVTPGYHSYALSQAAFQNVHLTLPWASAARMM